MSFFKSIKNKAYSILVLLISIILVIAAATSGQSNDSVVINIAGRQRMLTQKMSKEAISRFFKNDKIKPEIVNNTVKLFEVSLKALLNGGTTYLDLGMKNQITLPPPFSEKIKKQLEEVARMWPNLKEKVIETNRDPKIVEKNLESLVFYSFDVLKAMNKAALLIQRHSEARISKSRLIQKIGIVLSILAALLFIRIISKHLITPITDIQRTFHEITEGNLTQKLKILREDEIGNLSENINKFIMSINNLINNVKNNISSVRETSMKIHSTSDEMSLRAKDQSNHANSTYAAINNLTDTSMDIAEAMYETREMSEESYQLTKAGGEIIENTIGAFNSILSHTDNLKGTVTNLASSTGQINNIIDVINDVSDQTNLLALNAAIEAARAGDAGRGFAVVADEVRKLAERSTKATKEIEHIIVTLQGEAEIAGQAMKLAASEVEKGSQLGNKSLEVLQEIIQKGDSVKNSAISAYSAVEKENASIIEINERVQRITTSSEESSSSIEELVSTAERLEKDTETMKAIVDRYRTV